MSRCETSFFGSKKEGVYAPLVVAGLDPDSCRVDLLQRISAHIKVQQAKLKSKKLTRVLRENTVLKIELLTGCLAVLNNARSLDDLSQAFSAAKHPENNFLKSDGWFANVSATEGLIKETIKFMEETTANISHVAPVLPLHGR